MFNSFFAPRSNPALQEIEWKWTQAQADAVCRDWSRGRQCGLRIIPLKQIFFIPYGAAEFRERARDPKGGPKYVRELSALMSDGVALPPAAGSFDEKAGLRGLYIAEDGNHRIAAAKRLGWKLIPMVVFTR